MTPQKKPEIEIVPYFHFAGHELFNGFIGYLKTLPKESVVFLEVTENALKLCEMLHQNKPPAEIEEFFRKAAGVHFSFNKIKENIEDVYPVYECCAENGLKLLPLETPESKKLDIQTRNSPEIDWIRANVERENMFADNVSKNVRGITAKICVACGTYHPKSLLILLSSKGFRPSIQLGFIPAHHLSNVKKLMQTGWLLRNKFLDKRQNEALALLKRRNELFQLVKTGRRTPPPHAVHL